MTLNELKVGANAIVSGINGKGVLRSRLLEMGVIPNTKITVVKKAPLGDPIEIYLRSYSLTLRLEDCKNIEVQVI